MTVNGLLEGLNYLIDNRYINGADTILICGTGDKKIKKVNSVILQRINKLSDSVLEDDKGEYRLGFYTTKDKIK